MNLNILQTLAADIRQFDEQVKAGTAELRARTSAGPTSSSAASHQAGAEPRFYIPNPLDECTNSLGHSALSISFCWRCCSWLLLAICSKPHQSMAKSRPCCCQC